MVTKSPVSSYKAHQQVNETVRETEAKALLSCASRLHKAQNPESGPEFYLDAIRHNQQLWTVFQVTLCEPDNPLPRDLKITLLNLSRFVDKVSLRAQAEYSPALLTSLIDINRQIAAGLNVQTGKPETEAHAVPVAEKTQPGSVSTSI
ncbi:MAG: flagellar biosynthesis regulator FlaF [Alphaproteobacteria bacterium]|nr:flagellar biosynthesis regulator FlaF [Alphaproteobacteria bacterium]